LRCHARGKLILRLKIGYDKLAAIERGGRDKSLSLLAFSIKSD